MIVTKKGKTFFYFSFFIIPAFFLYFLFFLFPFFQGVIFSFTDWNGITPEIRYQYLRGDFEEKVIKKLKNEKDIAVIKRYYTFSNNYYTLQEWIEENGKTRRINLFEKNKIKSILAKAGIRSIHFIGFDNYKEIFTNDKRFLPSVEKRFLFEKNVNSSPMLNNLIKKIPQKRFDKLLKNLGNVEKDFLKSKYSLTKYYEIKNYQYLDKIKSLFKNHNNNLNSIEEKDFYKIDNYKGIKKYYKLTNYYLLANELSAFDMKILGETFSKHYYEYRLIGGAVGFTLFFTIFNVIFTNIIAMFLALALDSKIRSKNFLRSLFFMPNVLSLVIVAFIWSFLFKIITRIPVFDIGWLGDPNVAPISIILVQVWQNCGYIMLIYLAGLQNIPSDILEVAEIDGANAIDKFFKITLPLLLPSLTISLFLTITNSLRCFDIIWVLTNGGPGYATTPIVVDIYNNAFAQNRFGYGTAKAILLCLIIIAITTIQLSIMKKKEVEY
ncbi:MAG TPA: sugar ABC transporter permease [Spirochaetota bacterium]|nr:sugar ABC transporter permease [Spirochaetota bacterium]